MVGHRQKRGGRGRARASERERERESVCVCVCVCECVCVCVCVCGARARARVSGGKGGEGALQKKKRFALSDRSNMLVKPESPGQQFEGAATLTRHTISSATGQCYRFQSPPAGQLSNGRWPAGTFTHLLKDCAGQTKDRPTRLWVGVCACSVVGWLLRPKLHGYTGCKRTCSVEQAVSCI